MRGNKKRFERFAFAVEESGDIFLDLDGWGKGGAFSILEDSGNRASKASGEIRLMDQPDVG